MIGSISLDSMHSIEIGQGRAEAAVLFWSVCLYNVVYFQISALKIKGLIALLLKSELNSLATQFSEKNVPFSRS